MEVGEACCKPGPPADEGGVVGKEEKCCGYDVYANWPPGSTKAVVFVPDVFGWKKPLLRKLVDETAAAGFVTQLPDYFKGDPLDSGKYALDISGFKEWYPKHSAESVAEDTLTIIKGLKEKGITSVGIAGFCYGAKVAVLSAKESVVDSVVVLHPSLLTLDDIKAVKAPLAILAAEKDESTPVVNIKGFETYLESQKEIEHFVKVFPGVSHGWTVRYDEKDPEAVSSAEAAHSDMISWFKKCLK